MPDRSWWERLIVPEPQSDLRCQSCNAVYEPFGYPPKPGHPIVSITYRNSLLALPRPGQLINLC